MAIFFPSCFERRAILAGVNVWFLFAKEQVEIITDGGVITALVHYLQAPEIGEGDKSIACEHEVENVVFPLGLLKVKA